MKGENKILSSKIGGLGKGLDLIFKENNIKDLDYEVCTIRISDIEPNRKQPRVTFDEKALSELADSIVNNGVLQPLLVRPIEGERYQIVAGERRWRASRMAGLTEVPVIIKDIEDIESMEIALIENLQREDLSPIEEARGYKILMEKYKLTQEETSKAVGKSRPAISNSLRLLTLPSNVINMIESEKITSGHARALLSLKQPNRIEKLAEEICDKGLSVRQVETLLKNIDNKKNISKNVNKKSINNHLFREVEISLRENFGRRAKVLGNKEKGGFLQIEFFDDDDLMGIVNLLNN